MPTAAYAAFAADQPLGPHAIERRAPGPTDVAIEILYCGVCHSDIHNARNEWGHSVYPVVPGHEIVGRVAAVGAQAGRFKPGEIVGAGCMVDSCRQCASCKDGLEQFCEQGATLTYGSPERAKGHEGEITQGGYATQIVVDQAFVLRIQHTEAQLAGVAPLLCAGITTYSPLRHWKVGPGSKVGIVGLGGLGHMGVKLARAMGAQVTLFTRSGGKTEDARRLGAHAVVLSSDAAAMAAQTRSFDFLLDTVSARHDVNVLLNLLKHDGTLVLVGAPAEPLAVSAFGLILGRKQLAGSLIGGIRETQEMLDFCAARNIVSDIEMIPIQKINEAYDRVVRSDVKYRFVIDIKSLKA